MGDPHGRYDAVEDVLEQVNFDDEKDKLTCLGDIVDGGPDSKKCIERFLKIQNFKTVKGNHDDWFLQWCLGKNPGNMWLEQGGRATLKSYGYTYWDDPDKSKVPASHIDFLRDAPLWLEDEYAICVHGGVRRNAPHITRPIDCLWDRDFIKTEYLRFKFNQVPMYTGKLVIVGHSCTQLLSGKSKPIILDHVIDLDTGAGHGSKLTLMQLPSRQYWQSRIKEFNLIRNEV